MILSFTKTVFILLFFLFLFGVDEAGAQKNTGRKRPAKKTASVIPPLDVRAAREKVEIQLENVERFVDEYSPKADALELLDAAYAKKQVSRARLDRHAENKKNIIQTIRNLRVGLAALEAEFRTKSALQKYLSQIQGITDLAGHAVDLASEHQFIAAKGPLRDVSRQLADSLAVIPK